MVTQDNKKERRARRQTHKQWPGALTWVSPDELWPGALLGRRGVGGANQLVLGHLGVGLGKLQPQGLGDLWIKPDPLRSNRDRSQHEVFVSLKSFGAAQKYFKKTVNKG